MLAGWLFAAGFYRSILARIIHEGSSRNRGDAMRDGRVEQ